MYIYIYKYIYIYIYIYIHIHIYIQESRNWKHAPCCVETKVREQRSVNWVMLTKFWDKKGPITIDFFEKEATVNRAFYC